MDKIIIKGLKIFAYHGVNQFEKQNGQLFILDIIIFTSINNTVNDNLNNTINYSTAIKNVISAFTEHSYDLIETAAQKVVSSLLKLSDKIFAVDVTVKKPEAPVNADFDYVAVNICRENK